VFGEALPWTLAFRLILQPHALEHAAIITRILTGRTQKNTACAACIPSETKEVSLAP
jgi:hypothetical protein